MILVESPGLFTTVQDLGRPGFGPVGISPSGAADAVALRVGNRLAGSPEGAAALEMTLAGGTFVFPEGAFAALAGSDFGAAVDGVEVSPWRPFRIPPGGRLRTGHTRSGARCYLCVRGGIEVKLFLGSASTHALSGLGGLEGRALRKGDVLHIGNSGAERPAQAGSPMPPGFRGSDATRACEAGFQPAADLQWTPPGGFQTRRRIQSGPTSGEVLCASGKTRWHWAGSIPRILHPRKTLRVTDAPQSEWFSAAARDIFYNSAYRVTEEASRMGLRLEGPPIPAPADGQMITEGVACGAVQIPAGGRPIILFVEQQTTGGYPKIANVSSADMSGVGQLRPRDEIRFERVDLAAARALLREQEEAIRAIYRSQLRHG